MWLVPLISIEGAKGKVKDIYADIMGVQGKPHLLHQCFANDPEVLHGEWQLEKDLLYGDSGLPHKLRQYISLTASMLYGCGG